MDFDGDAMGAQIMMDNYLSEMSKFLSPHRNILDPNIPRTINDHPSMAKTVVSNTGNWFREVITSTPTAAMEEFAI